MRSPAALFYGSLFLRRRAGLSDISVTGAAEHPRQRAPLPLSLSPQAAFAQPARPGRNGLSAGTVRESPYSQKVL